MFDNLVETTSDAQKNRKQNAYLGITTVTYGALLAAILVWSIFSFDLAALNENEELLIKSLLTPADIPENTVAPPIPKDKPQTKTDSAKSTPKNFDSLRDPIANIDNSTKPPEGVSTEKAKGDVVRERVPFLVGVVTERATGFGDDLPRREGVNAIPPTVVSRQQTVIVDNDIEPPPAPKPKVSPSLPAQIKPPPTVSKGVINSIAVSLPKPIYSPAAKAVGASGQVQVQVTIDEKGNVVSATVVSGHPLLRAAAQTAAKQAKFTPTRLSDQPVKVTEVIVYNFLPQ